VVDPSLRKRASTARAALEAGHLRGPALRELFLTIPAADRDAWADELLLLEEPPPSRVPLPRGGVPYLPCGVDDVLTMVQSVPIGPEDDFVDLGSGLGRVAILVHLLTGARTAGVEIQAALVQEAQHGAQSLALPAVTFLHADAADVELAGSVFFLYAPFNGALLVRVLDRLRAVAERRSIVVCTVALELAHVPWLTPRSAPSPTLHVYDGGVR
jgi:SAM-dependent methyltransferase